MQLRLNSLENTRKSFCRILREYEAGRLEDGKARTLGYLLNGILQYWRLERDIRIEEEIETIKEELLKIRK